MMEVSYEGLNFIKKHEGAVKINGIHVVYDDATGKPVGPNGPIGYATIGYGHLITKSETTSGKIYIFGTPVRYAEGITERQAEDLLDQDLDKVEDMLTDLDESYNLNLSTNEFDALASFAFNLGTNALKNSTLLKLLIKGDRDGAAAQFRRWNRFQGNILPGLTRRRLKEEKLFTDGIYN